MKSVILTFALAALSTPAFAGAPNGLTFDEIREACSNPGKFQNQIAPTNLQVTCDEHLTRWLPYNSKEMDLLRSRYITASLTSDKYQVSPTQHPMNVEIQKALCPSYKEVLEVTSFTKATSCDEILGFKGDEQDFCADILDRARQSNPKIVQMNETGRIVEFCAVNDNGQQQKPGKDQGKDQNKDQGKGKGQGK